MKKLLLLLAIGAGMLMSSCIKPEKLSLDGIENIQMKGVTPSQIGLDLGVRATNASGSNLWLTDIQLMVNKDGRKIFDIVLREKAELPRKSSGVLILPLAIRFDGPLGALGAYTTLSKGLTNLTVSGTITGRTGWAKKTFEIKELPLDNAAAQFGLDPSALIKNL